MADDTPQRLQKLIAQAGLASRRQAETWIEAGRVQVNGEPAKLGDRATPDDVVTVDGRPLPESAETCQVVAYHKPAGQITSRSDEQGRPTVFDNLPELSHGRWIAVGRLDFPDFRLAAADHGRAVGEPPDASERAGAQRRYLVRVRGAPSLEQLEQLTVRGWIWRMGRRSSSMYARSEARGAIAGTKSRCAKDAIAKCGGCGRPLVWRSAD